MRRMVFPWLVPDDPASFASFKAHAQLITHVSPTWYRMAADGKVTPRLNADSPELIAIARARGISVHPLIVNEGFNAETAHAILASPESRQRAAETIAGLVLEGDFDGINMDFEGTFGRSRDYYTDLLRRIGEILRPKGKWLTVDVVCQTQAVEKYPVETSWASPFDYAALGELCDRVMLMGYDYAMAEPGPVTPLWWLEEVIDYTLGLIPKERVVVGLPFYNRHWVVKEGQVSRPAGPKRDERARLVARSGRPPVYSDRDATYHVVWTDVEGEHHVYWDDAVTLWRKLKLVRDKGIDGVAFWRLGQEDEACWGPVAQWMEG